MKRTEASDDRGSVIARTLNEMLARSVERSGNLPAFIFKGQEMSYDELADVI